MMRNTCLPMSIFVCQLVFCCNLAFGDLVIQATSVTTDMPGLGNAAGDPNNVRDQSGLSAGYTSGVTDFDTYMGSGILHDAQTANVFGSAGGTTTGTLNFDLGAQQNVSAFAFWNFGSDSPANVVEFSLEISDDDTFASSTNLGTFSANTNLGPGTALPGEVFNFAETSGRYVRMNILSNNGGGNTIFGEVAFKGNLAIPEPSSACVLVVAGVFLLRRRR